MYSQSAGPRNLQSQRNPCNKTRAVACQYNPSGQVIHFFFADAHFTDAHLRLQHALLLPERSLRKLDAYHSVVQPIAALG